VHETGHHGGHTVSTRESGKKVVVHAIQRVLVIKEFNQHVLGPKSLNKRYQGRLTLLLLTQRGCSVCGEGSSNRSFTASRENHPVVSALFRQSIQITPQDSLLP
jgi:hypothetical protein